jgi:hypothetical protein
MPQASLLTVAASVTEALAACREVIGGGAALWNAEDGCDAPPPTFLAPLDIGGWGWRIRAVPTLVGPNRSTWLDGSRGGLAPKR